MSEHEPPQQPQRRKSRSTNTRSLSPRTSLIRRGLSPVITPVAQGLRRLRNLGKSQSPRVNRPSKRLPGNLPFVPSTPSKSSHTLTHSKSRPSFGPHTQPRHSGIISDDDEDDDEDFSQPLAPPSFRNLPEELLPDSKKVSRPPGSLGNGKTQSQHSDILVEENAKPSSRSSGVSQARSMSSPLIDEEKIQRSPSSSPELDTGREVRKHSSKGKKKSSSEIDAAKKPTSCPSRIINARGRALVDEEEQRRPASDRPRSRSTKDRGRERGNKRSSREKISTSEPTKGKKRSSREKISTNTNEPTQVSDKRPSRPSPKHHESIPEAAGHIKSEKRRSNSEERRHNFLDKKSLQGMKDIKDSIKEMRTNRRKVKFNERGALSPIPGSTQGTPMHVAPPSAAATSASFGPNPPLTKDFNSSLTRFGEITMDDLEVGFFKKDSYPTASQQQLQQQESLQKQIKKTKKLIKRTYRDVWSEREEITNLQRKNWSIRKTLMKTDTPQDSLTTLNLKIENLVRQDRELDLENDQIEEEKHHLEQECSQLAKAIGEFKDLLDELNKKIVPLLPPEEEPIRLSSSDELSDSINSTETDDEDAEGSMSLSHLRLLSPLG